MQVGWQPYFLSSCMGKTKAITYVVPGYGILLYPGKYINKYVGPGTRATEGFDFDQVLSYLQDNSS